MTVAVILGGGVQGGVEAEVEGSFSFFGFGAKKREITCCFGFPIFTNVAVVDRRSSPSWWRWFRRGAFWRYEVQRRFSFVVLRVSWRAMIIRDLLLNICFKCSK